MAVVIKVLVTGRHCEARPRTHPGDQRKAPSAQAALLTRLHSNPYLTLPMPLRTDNKRGQIGARHLSHRPAHTSNRLARHNPTSTNTYGSVAIQKGTYPHVLVRDDGRAVVSQAGSVLLVETVRRAGLDRAISAALAPWRKPQAIHDPGRYS